MRLIAAESSRKAVERTHSIYAMNCPLCRKLHKAIQLTLHSNSWHRRSVTKL